MAGRPGAVLQDRQADRAEVPGALRPRPRACAHTPSGSVQRFSSGTLGDSDTLCWYQKRQAGRPRLPPSFRLPRPDRLLLRGPGLCRRCQLGQPSRSQQAGQPGRHLPAPASPAGGGFPSPPPSAEGCAPASSGPGTGTAPSEEVGPEAQAGARPGGCVGPAGPARPGCTRLRFSASCSTDRFFFMIWFHFFHSLCITSYHS